MDQLHKARVSIAQTTSKSKDKRKRKVVNNSSSKGEIARVNVSNEGASSAAIPMAVSNANEPLVGASTAASQKA